jgi:nucleoid DNA-binding protein
MDIDLLSKMVKELILDNDRVVLPGLGSFVAEIVPSTFSDKGYTINPPYRKLYFRAKPDEGTELVQFYAKTNNVDFAVAERIIKDFISELRPVIHTKKIVVFPGLGRLRATKENNLFFVADEDLDIYPDGFALEPVSLKTHQETREEVAAVVTDLKSILQKPEPEVIPEPEVVPAPEVAPEPEVVQEPAPVPVEDEPVAEQVNVEPEVEEPKVEEPETTVEEPATEEPVVEAPVEKKRGLLKALIVVLSIILVLLLVYAVVGRVAPDFVDSFLYTPEELKILNHKF